MALSFPELSKYLSKRDFGPSMELTSHTTEDMSPEYLPWYATGLPWNGLSCLSIVYYVLKFCSHSEHSDVFEIICRLDGLAQTINNASMFPQVILQHVDVFHGVPNDCVPEIEKRLSKTFVKDFMPKVRELVTIPKEKENLVGFIHFLLQILNSETNPIQRDGYERSLPIQEDLRSLQKRLTFILAVLGDIPFQCTEMKELENILKELEAVANEVWSFIYSQVFPTCSIDISCPRGSIRLLFDLLTEGKNMDCTCTMHMVQFRWEINVLMENVDFLNEKIKEYCMKFAELPLSISVNANAMNVECADSHFIVDSILEDLENIRNLRVDLTKDIKHWTDKLHGEVTTAQSFLKDINLQQEVGLQEMKECVIKLRNVAYEADYLINSFGAGNFPDWYLSIRIPNVIQKINLIEKSFKELKTRYGVKDSKVEEYLATEVSSQAAVLPHLLEDDVSVELKDKMIELLNDLTGGTKNLQIISIYGMPGIGKTNLAKKLYSDSLITNHFDQRAWCVVSQTYQMRNVLIDILTSLKGMQERGKILMMDDEKLISHMYKSLKGVRYIIIIDDVWDSNVWDDLKRYFPNDKMGSRILSTTRIQDTIPVNSLCHTPPFLSKDQCWELLEKKVFRGEPCPPQLQQLGLQIAEKCNGLPLAVVVVAGILANAAKSNSVWEKVEQSLGTYTSNCNDILELSYKHLPNHLKLCFLYLGVFPEDAEIPVRELIWLWIAEGFIRKDEHRNPEDIAMEYLTNLVNRSLVLVAKNRSNGGVKACSIHDLLRDMCLKKAQEENFLKLVQHNYSPTYERHHRLCVLHTSSEHLRPFSLYCRSFLGHLSDPSSCLPQMKHLRVMRLLPPRNIICKLKRLDLVHLRYLVVYRMPEPTLSNLANIEILVIDTFQTVYVPTAILIMGKLRHLRIKLHAVIEDDCYSLQPNNLHSLSFVSLTDTRADEILASSRHLRILKCFCPAPFPDFGLLTELESLNIKGTYLSPVDSIRINFPSTIRKLSLCETYLPWEKISLLGTLPKLQVLKLLSRAFEGKTWETSDNEFSDLRFLKLQGLELEEWITSSDHFPILQHLVLSSCDKLLDIPSDLGNIPSLNVINVIGCSHEARESAAHIKQEQRDNGNKELKVMISKETGRQYDRWRKAGPVWNVMQF